MNLRRSLTAWFCFALLAMPRVSMACATCFGAEGSQMTTGSNNAIIFLLVVIGLVQAGFLALFIMFWRRSRANRRLREQFHVVSSHLS